MGSAILSAYFGLSKGVRKDHINYLAIWMQHVKDDPEVLLKATALAQKACDSLLNIKKGRKRK
jgi:antirestriction protein ArdC